MASDRTEINPFSVRILNLESALRFAHFSVEESENSLKKLMSSNPEVEEKGRQQAIRLFRSLQSKIMLYDKVRASIDSISEEKLLIVELKLLSSKASEFLVRIKSLWDREEAIKLLESIISLEKKVKIIIKKLDKKTPKGKVFYAGIDGGAISTKTVIADKDGKIIGKARSGPSSPKLVGVVRTFESLISGLKKATEKAGLNFETTHFKRICAGMAWINTPEDHRRMNELMNTYIHRFHNNIKDAIIIQDTLLAWYGAFLGEPGILMISGTGHVIYGRNGRLETRLVGRNVVGDWDTARLLGGREISYHAALVILDKVKRRSETRLVRYCRDAFLKKEIFPRYSRMPFISVIRFIENSMIKRISTLTDDELSEMAKIVIMSAEDGDRDAVKIIDEAIHNAALIISAGARKLKLHGKKFKVAYVGSVILHPWVLPQLRAALPIYEPKSELVEPELDPLEAGIEIARNPHLHFY